LKKAFVHENQGKKLLKDSNSRNTSGFVSASFFKRAPMLNKKGLFRKRFGIGYGKLSENRILFFE